MKNCDDEAPAALAVDDASCGTNMGRACFSQTFLEGFYCKSSRDVNQYYIVVAGQRLKMVQRDKLLFMQL